MKLFNAFFKNGAIMLLAVLVSGTIFSIGANLFVTSSSLLVAFALFLFLAAAFILFRTGVYCVNRVLKVVNEVGE